MCRKMKFYIVTDSTDLKYETKLDSGDSRIYTITTEFKECKEFIDTMLYYKHFNHFENWCNCHNLDCKLDSSWNKYVEDVLSEYEEDKYYIGEIRVSKKELATIMRLYYHYIPMGCSYESSYEIDMLNKAVDYVINSEVYKNED